MSVGPFAYLRPGTRCCAAGAKVGTFVEVKNSDIGAARENPAPLLHRRRGRGRGARTSARARSRPTTTAASKHRTTIGKRVRGGVDTSFVAPVTVGDDAYTAAGSVVTEDVPAGALARRAGQAGERRGIRRATSSALYTPEEQ